MHEGLEAEAAYWAEYNRGWEIGRDFVQSGVNYKVVVDEAEIGMALHPGEPFYRGLRQGAKYHRPSLWTRIRAAFGHRRNP